MEVGLAFLSSLESCLLAPAHGLSFLSSEMWELFLRPEVDGRCDREEWVCSSSLLFQGVVVALCNRLLSWKLWLRMSHFSAVLSRMCLRDYCWWFFFSSLQLVNRHLYSGSADRTVKCWLVDTGERIQTYKAHKHSVSTLKYHAGICKLPFLCSAIPCLLCDVCLWSKIVNREYCNFEGFWNCYFFQLQHVYVQYQTSLHTPCGKLRSSLCFPPPSSGKWRGSCFISVTKGSGLNPELSVGCLYSCGLTSLVWCLSVCFCCIVRDSKCCCWICSPVPASATL